MAKRKFIDEKEILWILSIIGLIWGVSSIKGNVLLGTILIIVSIFISPPILYRIKPYLETTNSSKKVIKNGKNRKHFVGSVGWLIFWIIVFLPIAIVYYFTNYEKRGG